MSRCCGCPAGAARFVVRDGELVVVVVAAAVEAEAEVEAEADGARRRSVPAMPTAMPAAA
jgi:hypothetical protein